jgi:ATP-dependent helicase STH1/SNF2
VQGRTQSQHQALLHQPQQPSLTNGHGPHLNGTSAATSGASLQSQASTVNQTPISFTQDQITTLRAQIQAFKLLSRGMPLPESMQQAIRTQNTAISDLEKVAQPSSIPNKIVDAAVRSAKGEASLPATPPVSTGADDIKAEETDVAPINPADLPKGPFVEDNVNSGIYPYNAFRHPFSHLKRASDNDPPLLATRLQRLLIPTIMPAGLDAHQILNERDRYIESRIQQRIRELEAMPSTMGDGAFDVDVEVKDEKSEDKENNSNPLTSLIHPSPTAHGKLRALIELKSLRVLDKQRAMRAMVAERLNHGSMLPLNRLDFRRTRKPTIRDARATEHSERRQRAERERRAKHKHVEQLTIICNHGREVVASNRNAQDRVARIGRAVLQFHVYTEKEEQKRIERLAKERLKALKADDEEAYMKLIDTAKDTRITHLLRQTDSFLDSLAQAVVQQQNEGGIGGMVYDNEPTSEATFGAQVLDEEATSDKKVDYYAVAHRISEKVARQPNMLVGGTLKEYQLKGLQWMVSLYNNKLNGILADEMVSALYRLSRSRQSLTREQGLGKTIQTISLVTFLIEVKRQRGPYLVIVPLSTMTNWSGEFAKWAPSVRMIAYKGNPTQRRALQADLRMNQFQVLLTTYEYIIKDRPHLSKIKWVHMIIGMS